MLRKPGLWRLWVGEEHGPGTTAVPVAPVVTVEVQARRDDIRSWGDSTMGATKKSDKKIELVQRVCRLLDSTDGETLKLAELASETGVSVFHLRVRS